MKTAGVDLSTDPTETGVCVVDWAQGRVCVDVCTGAQDADLIGICQDDKIDKVGIDCPFGWPAPFVAAISAHALGQAWPGRDQPFVAFGKTLAFRLTDLKVEMTVPGARPLSVATDKIGKTAMRGALILDALGVVDRSGHRGRVAEVYPTASLCRWGLHHHLKVPRHLKQKGRDAVLEQLEKLMPTLTFQPGARDRCVKIDHAFDALICAITARAVKTGRTTPPETDEEKRLAAIEGWIHVPTDDGPGELVRPCSTGQTKP